VHIKSIHGIGSLLTIFNLLCHQRDHLKDHQFAMVLDPISALGLAGNLVQFVDFLFKLVSESRGIYKSATGALNEHAFLEKIAVDLSKLSDSLPSTTLGVTGSSSLVGHDILDLAAECKDVSRRLLGALEEIKVKGSHRRWKSFVQALKSVWKREEIEELTRRLDRIQNLLNTRLLAMMK
jgi:hypothetical protein